MSAKLLRKARAERGWTQREAAARLGVTQAYLSMLEEGARSPSPKLARRLMRVYGLPPTVLPVSHAPANTNPDFLAAQLGALGYPGFVYLRSRAPKKNPHQVVLTALTQPSLEARVVEALPWLLVRYADADTRWLEDRAKLGDLQNRLGFVVSMAERVAEGDVRCRHKAQVLAELRGRLYRSRLAREDTLCQESMTEAERRWLRKNRSEEARKWNLLTQWRLEHFPRARDA